MRNDCFFCIIILLSALAFQNTSFAQKYATPLSPQEAPTQREIGLFIGMGPNWQSGNIHSANCNCPDFTDGSKFGFSVGPLYEQDFSASIQWGGALLYEYMGLQSSYRKGEIDTAISTTDPSVKQLAALDFRQSSYADFGFLTLRPYIKWSAFDFLYFKLGISLSYGIYSHLNHTKQLLTTSARLSNGEPVSIKVDGYPDGQQVIYNDVYPNFSPFQVSINPMVGFNFYLGKNVFISPGFEYSLPLTKMTSDGTGLIVNSWRAFVELRVALSMRYKR